MQRIHSIDDPRVAGYRNVRDRILRGEELFIAEGRLLTCRLLQSRYPVESVLVAERHAQQFEPLVGHVPLYAAPESLLQEIVGFRFHRGVLAVGRRGEPTSLVDLMPDDRAAETLSLFVCPRITNLENLGLMFRSAAAFGINGVLLGQECCDPFSRRCLKVSMGAVLHIPTVTSADLLADLKELKDRWDVELFATVLDDRAESLAEVSWPRWGGLLLGNEFEGLAQPWIDVCDRRVTIPMQSGTDSLNVGVAAGIFAYEMTRQS